MGAEEEGAIEKGQKQEYCLNTHAGARGRGDS